MNTPIQSAGEAMPISPTLLSTIYTLTNEVACILATNTDCKIDRITITEHGVHTSYRFVGEPMDLLAEAISEYRSGCRAFCQLPEMTDEAEQDAIATTYGPPMKRLSEWENPATTLDGVLAALRLIRDESLVAGPMAECLLNAAIGFYEGTRT